MGALVSRGVSLDCDAAAEAKTTTGVSLDCDAAAEAKTTAALTVIDEMEEHESRFTSYALFCNFCFILDFLKVTCFNYFRCPKWTGNNIFVF